MAKNNERKFKLNKIKKAGSIIGVLLIVATGGAVKFATNSTPTDKTTVTTISTDYIDVEKTNELKLYDYDQETRTININNYEYLTFSDKLDNDDYTFDYAQYYGLDKTLELYNNTKTEKSTESDLLDENGKLDANKLLHSVKNNNEELMSGKTNAITTFYTETSEADMQKICTIIAKVVNSKFSNTEINQVANTLTKLTIVNRTGTASNAYINNNLTFVYNPNMSEMYSNMQKITGSENTKEETIESIITHEAMHILQYENNDLNKKNGIEVGMCRMYNVPNETKLVPVDSLYYPWLLEAAAELGMAEFQHTETGTYAKKISYARSYNLSRFKELNTKEQSLEKIVYENTLTAGFDKLNLTNKEEQLEFLKFLYSVEITQSNPEDFWENYKKMTGHTPTEEQQLDIRMQIRTEAVKYMSKNFYQNLIESIKEQEITDLDTVFYMMRIWEMDTYTHLEYTKESSLDSSKDFIIWQNQIQDQLFTAIGNCSELSQEEIKKLYDEYNVQTNIDNNIQDNCNLTKFNNYTQNMISSIKNTYAVSNFARMDDMLNYMTTEKKPEISESPANK